jgi:hypothetical protein
MLPSPYSQLPSYGAAGVISDQGIVSMIMRYSVAARVAVVCKCEKIVIGDKIFRKCAKEKIVTLKMNESSSLKKKAIDLDEIIVIIKLYWFVGSGSLSLECGETERSVENRYFFSLDWRSCGARDF